VETLIEAINLSKQFNHLHAAQNVSINLQQGDVLGFLGPNGAGKTTTMRMIAGYLPPDAGEVKIAGINVWKQPMKAKANWLKVRLYILK
jgi:ABC-2 type transport system ATP-binding protein